MTTWISFDLDWATGDCYTGHSCAWQCDGCGTDRGRGASVDSCYEPLEAFAVARNWLMSLNIIKPIIVRDCHAGVARLVSHGDKIVNFDAHFDDERYLVANDEVHMSGTAWQDYGGLNCGNWVTFVRNHGVSVVQWTKLKLPRYRQPVRLFIAVSSPYTSPICDTMLLEMLTEMGDVDFDLGVRANQTPT